MGLTRRKENKNLQPSGKQESPALHHSPAWGKKHAWVEMMGEIDKTLTGSRLRSLSQVQQPFPRPA